MAKTLYELLGLPKTAKPEEIKEAYVKHAARLRESGATGEAEVLKQAYDVLSDPKMRVRYDRQAYAVGSSPVAIADPAERPWYRSWIGALIGVIVIGVAYYAWSTNQREQLRLRLEHERLEARRLADEAERAAEARQRAADQRAADERYRAAVESAQGQAALNAAARDAQYRESVQYRRDAYQQQIQMQQDRENYRREEVERRRIDLENQRQLARDKRQALELERTSPRRF